MSRVAGGRSGRSVLLISASFRPSQPDSAYKEYRECRVWRRAIVYVSIWSTIDAFSGIFAIISIGPSDPPSGRIQYVCTLSRSTSIASVISTSLSGLSEKHNREIGIVRDRSIDPLVYDIRVHRDWRWRLLGILTAVQNDCAPKVPNKYIWSTIVFNYPTRWREWTRVIGIDPRPMKIVVPFEGVLRIYMYGFSWVWSSGGSVGAISCVSSNRLARDYMRVCWYSKSILFRMDVSDVLSASVIECIDMWCHRQVSGSIEGMA